MTLELIRHNGHLFVICVYSPLLKLRGYWHDIIGRRQYCDAEVLGFSIFMSSHSSLGLSFLIYKMKGLDFRVFFKVPSGFSIL